MNVLWWSAGVSSTVALTIAVREDPFIRAIYCDIDDHHPDNLRFKEAIEYKLDKEIEVIKSPLASVNNACLSAAYVNGPSGACCTHRLKRLVRKQWERDNDDGDLTYWWGLDADERKRADRIVESMPKQKHRFPLIEQGMSKENAHGFCCDALRIRRPAMYDLGYNNNNCIGCVKGGMGYWNKIRVDFPDVFASRAAMERTVGNSCIKGVFLDELDPNAGRDQHPIVEDCGLFCLAF